MDEARRFMLRTARTLVRLLGPARALRGRLKRTAEYRQAVALADAGREDEGNALPAYDLAAALEGNFELDAADIACYLREAAARARPSPRHVGSPRRAAQPRRFAR